MTRFIFFSLVVVFTAPSASAQTWYEANNPYAGNVLSLHETSEGALLCGTTRGLYKSVDGGGSWQSISAEYAAFATIGVSSTPDDMYIALFGYFLRRSFNGGQTWETLPAQDWTSLNNIVVNSAGAIFINTNNSVWRSTNNGDSWTQLMTDQNVPTFANLEISPDGDLFGSSYNNKIFRSSDDGDSWEEVFDTEGTVVTYGFAGDDVIYAGTTFSGIYRSEDNGDSWSTLPTFPESNGVLDLAVNSSGTLFAAGSGGGAYESETSGSTWTEITDNITNRSVKQVFITSSEVLLAGTQVSGLFQKEGAQWTAINEGINAIYINRFISIDGVLYACSDAGVFTSEDGGQTWQQSIAGMDDTEITALAKAPNGDLYAGGEMLYVSADGINWDNISQGFPGGEVTATDILVEPDGRLVVATEDYGIRYSDDEGQSWSTSNTGLEEVDMVFVRRNNNGSLFTSDSYNLYRSDDLSGSWEIINNGLTDNDVTEFTVANNALFAITYSDGMFKSVNNGDSWILAYDQDFRNATINGNEIYAASESVVSGGVYHSTDNGATWSNIGDGLPGVQVEEVDYVQGLGLFVNVRDFGLYTLDFSVIGQEELSRAFGRIDCFPNPFSGSTSVFLELENEADISYSIFNLSGQLAQWSHVGKITKYHPVQIGADLPAGVYLVRFETDQHSQTIRIVKRD